MAKYATVVGVFADQPRAEAAINDLHNLGLSDDQIGFISRDTKNTDVKAVGPNSPSNSKAASHTAAGAAGGGVAGGIIGAAASLLIPGVGPVIAGGILAATVGTAVVGAAAGSVVGALTSLGVSDQEASYYQKEFEAGHVLVTVNAPERQQEVADLLRRHGAYNAETRPTA